MTVPATHRRPMSIDAERSVLGALLADPERFFDLDPDLTPSEFADPVHAAIFAAIRSLHEERRPVDFVTVAEVLKADSAVQRAGGVAFLGQLAANVPTSSHAAHYAAIIRDRALHRRLQDYGARVAAVAADETLAAGDVLERAEQELSLIE